MWRKKEIGNQQKDSRKIGGKVINSIEKNWIPNSRQKRVNFCANLPTSASKPSYEPGLQVCVEIWTLLQKCLQIHKVMNRPHLFTELSFAQERLSNPHNSVWCWCCSKQNSMNAKFACSLWGKIKIENCKSLPFLSPRYCKDSLWTKILGFKIK